MTEEIYYVKRGRRYVPVSYYDSNLLDGLPAGYHLISVKPGSVSRRHNVTPALAPLIAASITAEDAVIQTIQNQQQLRPAKTHEPLTPEQRAAWETLTRLLNDPVLYSAGSWEIAQAVCQALIAEAEKLLEYPAVKAAYEEFLMLAKLTRKPDT